MAANLHVNDSEAGAVLYMAFELSDKKWSLAFGGGERRRQVVIAAGALEELRAQIAKVREKWGLGEEVRVVSCYEAGRDGFWLHRFLAHSGIANVVVDSASMTLNPRVSAALLRMRR